MPNSQLLKNWIALSVLFHLTVLVLASMIPLVPLRPPDVMIVDLADLPRSIDFPRPQPGIVEGAPPKPPAPAPPQPVRKEKPPPAPPPPAPPPPAAPKSLREITPSLGKMVMAKADPGAGRGGGTSSGNAVGTGGKAVEKGPITEEQGGGARLHALNAPGIQSMSSFL